MLIVRLVWYWVVLAAWVTTLLAWRAGSLSRTLPLNPLSRRSWVRFLIERSAVFVALVEAVRHAVGTGSMLDRILSLPVIFCGSILLLVSCRDAWKAMREQGAPWP